MSTKRKEYLNYISEISIHSLDYQQSYTNFLLYKTPNGLFMRPYLSKNASISAINIRDASNISTIVSEDERYKKNKAFNIDYENRIIYILKESKQSNFLFKFNQTVSIYFLFFSLFSNITINSNFFFFNSTDKKVLDVINYNEQNEFKRIHRIYKIFKNANSIASDSATGRIYFTENINSSKSSIKFTDKTFKISKLITHWDQIKSKILVYPKKG